MKVALRILQDGTVSIEGIAEPLFQMLAGVKSAAEADDPRVESRFFQSPSEDPEATGLCEDWKAFVQPDLHAGFATARDAVAADLRGATSNSNGSRSFTIPRKHIDYWLCALNQARLALAEVHGFTDAEMSRQPGDLDNPHEYALLQTSIYGMLQEWLIALLD
jgi:hypothetical protein